MTESRFPEVVVICSNGLIMKYTCYGHSCFAVEIMGRKILFDPFITHNELAAKVDIHAITADYIFVSHGHEDHTADHGETWQNGQMQQ